LPSLSDLLYRTVDGVFAVDSKQRIVLFNAACGHLLGIPPKDVLGTRCCGLLKGITPLGEPFCQERCCVADLTKGGRAPHTFPLRVRSSDGHELKLWVSIILVPSSNDDSWLCVHLLRREAPLNILEAFDDMSSGPGFDDRTSRDIATAERPSPGSLTSRERTVVELLAEGLSTATIARILGIQPVTVRNHLQHIQTKLNVHSKVEIVTYAYRHNLIQRPAGVSATDPKEAGLSA